MNALDKIRKKIRQYHLIDERSLVPELINLINLYNKKYVIKKITKVETFAKP